MIFKNKKYHFHFITILALFIYMSAMFYFTISQAMKKSSEWQRNLQSNVTIEIPYNANVNEAVATLRSLEDVKVVTAIAPEEKKQILEKWISNIDVSSIPISNIINVQMSSNFDLDKLKNSVGEKIDGATLYSNSSWGEDILQMAKLVFYMSIFMMSLIVIISLVLINFTTKSLLNTYDSELDILHLNGADDSFISNMICKSIFKQSIKASFIAILGANITMYVLSKSFGVIYALNTNLIVINLLIIVAIAIITSLLAKFNVERELRD